MEIKENVGTFVFSAETVTLIAEWGVRNVSILWISGIVTVKGTMKLGARTDDPITLGSGSPPLNIGFDFSIDGLEINCSAGQAIVVTGR
jgi:hypothetical protein